MDYKKSDAPTSTITRDLREIEKETGNIYESLVAISKRANQISVEVKEELSRKLEEFASYTDTWKKSSRIANKLKFRGFTSVCQNQLQLPLKNLSRVKFIIGWLTKNPRAWQRNKPFEPCLRAKTLYWV